METGLAQAVEAIQNKAIEAATPEIISIGASDGKGGSLSVPVAVQATKDGVTTRSFLEELQKGISAARDLRLRNAEGPDRREGTARHQSLASFIAHTNRFKAENSAIWADELRRTLVSVLDYHPAGAESPARWGKHRGTYECPLSEAWRAWGGGNPLKLDQDAFAALLDSRDRELVPGKLPNGATAPDPSWLVSFASSLEVYSSATARRERDPNTGRLKISYSEEKGVSGSLMPPGAFLIRVPIFQDSAPVVLEVRLRVEVEEGAATFVVQIHAAGDVLREAFDGLCSQVYAETAVPVFCGTPE